MMQYPTTRMRRNRQSSWSRELMAENRLSVSDLILPTFVQEGEGKVTAIESMPDVNRYTVDKLVDYIKEAESLGIPAIALFPQTPDKKKNASGDEALNENNLMCRAVKEIKKANLNIGIICDVALDPYTDHGHDGVLENGKVANDKTVRLLAKQAVVLAKAGADYVAPSDMMDGRIGVIRNVLDQAAFENVGIIAYAAKYASHFYGPFRDAVGSKGKLAGASKSTYQMDYRNSKEALAEVRLDVNEGADMVMVKPGLPYLDIVKTVSEEVEVPILAYQVSGEYAMLKAAAEKGWLDYGECAIEALTAFKRAGASAILTYSAIDVGYKLRGENT